MSKINTYIDSHRERALTELCELLAIPSVSTEPDNATDEQHVTPNGTGETSKTKQLEHEVEHLRQLVTAQQSHIDSLKQAMLLIESKLPATQEPVKQPVVKKSWQFWKK